MVPNTGLAYFPEAEGYLVTSKPGTVTPEGCPVLGLGIIIQRIAPWKVINAFSFISRYYRIFFCECQYFFLFLLTLSPRFLRILGKVMKDKIVNDRNFVLSLHLWWAEPLAQ